MEKPEIAQVLVPRMLKINRKIAEKKVPSILEEAVETMTKKLTHEVGRLQDLSKVNKNVRSEEIKLAESQLKELEAHILNARLRLDGVRLIWKGSLEQL